nr:immunoglobulin heavy chain junction region [Mus musculus]MBK4197759.1 immunoglobulin heavy chain junction region [Mus musculus]
CARADYGSSYGAYW